MDPHGLLFLPGWLERIFREVWSALPNRAQRLLFERLEVVHDGWESDDRPTDLAGCVMPDRWTGRSCLWLNASWLAGQSTGVVRSVIGHELAHVWRGHVFQSPELETAEADADALAEKWGFAMPPPLERLAQVPDRAPITARPVLQRARLWVVLRRMWAGVVAKAYNVCVMRAKECVSWLTVTD